MKRKDLPLEDSPYLLDEHGPIFVLGCPRSGTTFLSHCIAAISGTEEFVGILTPPRLLHIIAHPMSEPIRSHLMDSVRDIFWQAFWRRIYFRGERLLQLLQGNIALVDILAEPTLQGHLFCYKEPFLCFAADHFSQAFPKSKFIHIIRDGRDNADSLNRTYPHALDDQILKSDELSSNKVSEIGLWRKKDGFNYPWWLAVEEEDAFQSMSNYGRYVRLWLEMTKRARSLGAQLPRSRYLELRYEDFVQSPVEYGQKIREFLCVGDSRLFRNKLKQAFSSSINISSKNQDQEKRREANAIAGELLKELGYS